MWALEFGKLHKILIFRIENANAIIKFKNEIKKKSRRLAHEEEIKN